MPSEEYTHTHAHIHTHTVRQTYIKDSQTDGYGVATISRLLKIIGLLCKRALYKRRYSAKETYNFKETTNRSHLIDGKAGARWFVCVCVCVRERERVSKRGIARERERGRDAERERERERLCV